MPPKSSKGKSEVVVPTESPQKVIKKRNRPDKASTIKGVNFDKATQKWLVRVSENGKQRYFGRYATQELAEKAAIDWKKTQPDATPTAIATVSPGRNKGKKQPPAKPPAKKEVDDNISETLEKDAKD